MNDFEKILIGGAVGFAFGITSGVLLEKWRDRKALRKSIIEHYMSEMARTPDPDPFCLLGILQRAGAWKLNESELKNVLEDIKGRGLVDPYVFWKDTCKDMKLSFSAFLTWAKNREVDFSNSDSAIKAIAAESDARTPPVPSKGGVFFA